MKALIEKLENLWVSVAFAEAGEHETLQHILTKEANDEASEEVRTAA